MTQPIRPIVVTIVIVIRVILAVAINQAHDLLWIHISAAFGSSFQQLLPQKICSTFLVRHLDIWMTKKEKKFRKISVKSSWEQTFICRLNGLGILGGYFTCVCHWIFAPINFYANAEFFWCHFRSASTRQTALFKGLFCLWKSGN